LGLRPAHGFFFIYSPALAVVAGASLLTAPPGVRVAQAMNSKPLPRILAALLYVRAA